LPASIVEHEITYFVYSGRIYKLILFKFFLDKYRYVDYMPRKQRISFYDGQKTDCKQQYLFLLVLYLFCIGLSVAKDDLLR